MAHVEHGILAMYFNPSDICGSLYSCGSSGKTRSLRDPTLPLNGRRPWKFILSQSKLGASSVPSRSYKAFSAVDSPKTCLA